ncbi:ATP synthase F1 subunit delta [Algibacter aquimarinus]|uniref:ATP synthase subunit delta n=1 Tax=Algibacter aquimarinus TaxID=1136748 RepID=A0ABP9HCE9_9FLAO
MAGARAAIRYAKAVLSLASNDKEASAINEDMKLIASTIAENEELRDVLQSPVITSTVKKSIILEVFKKANKATLNLVDTLISNNRLDILVHVASKYNQLYDESKGIQLATVTTAVALSADLKKQVLAKAKELTGNDIEVENIIDESIIGGFILRIGDVQYNASIANQLSKLKREFTLN